MEPPDLPSDLDRVQRLLKARKTADPSPEHRARLLEAVRRELAYGESRRARPALEWKTVAALAAGLLLALNLMMSVANHAQRPTGGGVNGPAVERTAAEICALVPDIGPREARRQALVLRGLAALEAAPAVPFAAWIEYYKEVPAWVMR